HRGRRTAFRVILRREVPQRARLGAPFATRTGDRDGLLAELSGACEAEANKVRLAGPVERDRSLARRAGAAPLESGGQSVAVLADVPALCPEVRQCGTQP